MSDIHGYLQAFETALEQIKLSNREDKLILLGDYIDNGSESFGVLNKIKSLEEKYPEQVITLLGNHDEWFCEWLLYDELLAHPTSETLLSIIPREKILEISKGRKWNLDILSQLRKHILDEFPNFVSWLTKKYESPRFYETENIIFVHAGIDEDLGENWKLGTPDNVLTNKFPPQTGAFYKNIVAGHVYSDEVAKDESYLGKVYFDGKSHYYIDGHTNKSGIVPVYQTEN